MPKSNLADVEAWLSAHCPHIRCAYYAGDVKSSTSIFVDSEGVERSMAFSNLRTRRPTSLAREREHRSTFEQWLHTNLPHLQLKKWIGNPQQRSTFLNKETGVEHKLRRDSLKEAVASHVLLNDQQLSDFNATTKWGYALRNSEDAIHTWLRDNLPHIQCIMYGGNSKLPSTFVDSEGHTKTCSYAWVVSHKPKTLRYRWVDKNVMSSWLQATIPHIEIVQQATSTNKVSTFRNTLTCTEFNCTFSYLQANHTNCRDVLGVEHGDLMCHSYADVTLWLQAVAPHVELVTYSGRVSVEKSLLRNTVTGEEWWTTINAAKTHFPISKFFTTETGGSSIEQKIEEMLKNLGLRYTHNKALIGGIRPDFVVEDKVVIECNGNYWHSDANIKDRNHHKKRLQVLEGMGYRVLMFCEDEIYFKLPIIESMLTNALGLSAKVHARKTTICVGEPTFFAEHHLMGKGRGKILSLQQGGQVVASMQTYVHKGVMEISRFCTAGGVSVVGGFSKLLKASIALYPGVGTVSTFIDRRYGTGVYLHALGFEKTTEYPSFQWIKGGTVRVHRLRFPGKTGYDANHFRLWDCGQAKYIKRV